jgi:hypothetical protein
MRRRSMMTTAFTIIPHFFLNWISIPRYLTFTFLGHMLEDTSLRRKEVAIEMNFLKSIRTILVNNTGNV